MNRLLRKTIGVVLATLSMHGYSAILQNGSFENVTAGLPDDWIASGNLQAITTQGATDGSYAVAFSFGNLPSNGSLSQTFATETGVSYQISFDFGKYSVNQPATVARLQVEVFDGTGFLGTSLLDQTVTDSTNVLSDYYTNFKYTFTSISTLSTLRFIDLSDAQSGAGGFDAMLDDVIATKIPEPSAAPTLVGFLVLAAATMGRRRNLS